MNDAIPSSDRSGQAEPATMPRAEAFAFFLATPTGQRLCIYHAPPPNTPLRAALLYIHPFGDEINRSRRMAALQARALAAADIAVLQIDLYGCGDSSGDFADARWGIWKTDLALAHAWLANVTGLPVTLWGLRLGALLALDYARHAATPVARFILWQPVTNGQNFLTQFLRLRLASELIAGAESNAGVKPSGTQGLRDRLRSGESLEIGGYELSAELALAIDELDAAHMAPVDSEVIWFDVVSEAGRPVSTAQQRLIRQWERDGAKVYLRCVTGSAFWATQEITECPALIAATLEALCTTFT